MNLCEPYFLWGKSRIVLFILCVCMLQTCIRIHTHDTIFLCHVLTTLHHRLWSMYTRGKFMFVEKTLYSTQTKKVIPSYNFLSSRYFLTTIKNFVVTVIFLRSKYKEKTSGLTCGHKLPIASPFSHVKDKDKCTDDIQSTISPSKLN